MFSDRKRREGKNAVTKTKKERNEGWQVERENG
jgi:hypothetical protein